MPREYVARLIASKKPFAARNWLKTLRGLMQFAVAAGLRGDDPTAGIDVPRARAGTIYTWSEAEIASFEARHEIGTRPRLAMALLLFTAARRGDAVGLGPQHIRNGLLAFRQQKTGRILEIPVHTELAAILAASPGGHLTFLTTEAGAPFSAAGFGNLFRRWCNEAGLSHCSAHGLRKAQARRTRRGRMLGARNRGDYRTQDACRGATLRRRGEPIPHGPIGDGDGHDRVSAAQSGTSSG